MTGIGERGAYTSATRAKGTQPATTTMLSMTTTDGASPQKATASSLLFLLLFFCWDFCMRVQVSQTKEMRYAYNATADIPY